MANAIPAVGSRISLVSSGDIRYEGILYSIDMVDSKIALQQGAPPLLLLSPPSTQKASTASTAPTRLAQFLVWKHNYSSPALTVCGSRQQPSQIFCARLPLRVVAPGLFFLRRDLIRLVCWPGAGSSEVVRHGGAARGRGASAPQRGGVRVHRVQR